MEYVTCVKTCKRVSRITCFTRLKNIGRIMDDDNDNYTDVTTINIIKDNDNNDHDVL